MRAVAKGLAAALFFVAKKQKMYYNKKKEVEGVFMPKFTEECIQQIFGPEAAEDESIDRLRSYYFKNDVYEKIHNDLPLRILVGHKGIGKSATFKISFAENECKKRIVVWIKPDDIIELCQNNNNLLQMIRDWKKGLSSIIFNKVLENVGIQQEASFGEDLNRFGKIITRLSEIFKKQIDDKLSTDTIKLDVIKSYLATNKIFVYIDDLDRGWSGHFEGIQRISALLNAARDLTNENPGLCFRISLRSDVYFLVRTSDESTDKIEGSVIWYSWTQHEILCMLAKRIQLYRGKPISDKQLQKLPQFKIAEYYTGIFEDVFEGRGKWNNVPTYKVLASMIRRRPRDLVKLCTMAARSAYEDDKQTITTYNWIDNFDRYSQERIQDTINEYKSELPDIERLLLGMKPSNRERQAGNQFIYTSEELLKKIEIIQGKEEFVFSKGTKATFQELAAFLYKINFLVARKRTDDNRKIDRKYFEEQKYLSNHFVDFGYQWEVHPAFRWALYPDAGINIYDTLSIDDEI